MFVIYDKEKPNLPIKVWLEKKEDLEPECLQQALNLSVHPVIELPVALMPDTHMGYGMPIGGVIACRNAVIPNAVGVDIGCFTGDTKIPLLNGTQKTLKELVEIGRNVFVYSLNKSLGLSIGKAIPKMTRKNAELIEVTISGGKL